MPTTVIGGYSRKCQWRPRLVPAEWSLLGERRAPRPGGGGGGGEAQWSERELKRVLGQVAITPTSTLVIAAPVQQSKPAEAR